MDGSIVTFAIAAFLLLLFIMLRCRGKDSNESAKAEYSIPVERPIPQRLMPPPGTAISPEPYSWKDM